MPHVDSLARDMTCLLGQVCPTWKMSVLLGLSL